VFCAATDAPGHVFVSDAVSNYRVQEFDDNGTFLATWGGEAVGAACRRPRHRGVVVLLILALAARLVRLLGTRHTPATTQSRS